MLTQWVAACVAAFTMLGGPWWQHPTRQARAQRWSEIIVDESLNQGEPRINPLVVVCVMFAESSFQPRAKGQRGEIGLFQVMPGGHAANGRSSKQLEMPEQNIRAGIQGLKRGLTECNQGVLGALAWHNRGRCMNDPEDVGYVRRVWQLYGRVHEFRADSQLLGEPQNENNESQPEESPGG